MRGAAQAASLVALNWSWLIPCCGCPFIGLAPYAGFWNWLIGNPACGIAFGISSTAPAVGVDRLMDMIRTAVNVSGDGVVSCIVAKSENKLDRTVFDNPDAGHIDVHESLHIDGITPHSEN